MEGGGETPSDGVRQRRRPSRQNDDAEPVASALLESVALSVPHVTEPSQASAVERRGGNPISGESPRVRFSTDNQHAPPQRRESRDDGARADAQAGLRGQGAGPSTPHAPDTLRAPSLVPALAPRDVKVTPASRRRGYSLRKSLFKRNMDEQVSQDTDIELEETVVPPPPQQMEGVKEEDMVKSGEATVTIAPTTNHGSFSDGSQNVRKGGTIGLPNYDTWLQARKQRHAIMNTARDYGERARKIILRIKDIPPSKDGRHIDLDPSRKEPSIDERTKQPYISNWIRSTRYSAWNFLPRQLVAQFMKLANFYFLCVSILQMIPGLSTTGTYTTIVPLLFFVTISILKEGYDDLRRYRLDKAENNRETKVLRGKKNMSMTRTASTQATLASDTDSLHWESVKWQDLHVGDVVRLERDEAVPADLALLYTSGENGVAYVETMALDGETNLKGKQTTASIAKAIESHEDIVNCGAKFTVEDPNQDLYNFEGRVLVDGSTAPLTVNEIIYRGSILRNTPDALGLVVYSGEECRIRMNANKNPRIKAPALQSAVNRLVFIIVIFVLLLAVFNTVAYQIWSGRTEGRLWYLSNASVSFFPNFTSFVIMFNTMIPLSLYVSLEIVKLAQMWFLYGDIDMYDEVSGTPCEPRTSTINEELGQISYIFSDKTGTLTDNSMKFRKLSVAGMAFLHDNDLQEIRKNKLLHKKRKEKQPIRKSYRSAKDVTTPIEPTIPKLDGTEKGYFGKVQTDEDEVPLSKWQSSARPGKSQRELLTGDMLHYIQRKPHTPFSRKARLFLLSLAICHTCLPEVHADGHVEFMAASPDELALVQAAQDMGFLVVNRDVHNITLKLVSPGTDDEPVIEKYEVIDVIEFSSKRKRMSIVVRFPDGRICIFCKGADTIVMQRLKLSTLANKMMVEIEGRASKRKSMEASYAMARKSEQTGRNSSIGGRMSLALGQAARGSLTLGRPSITITRTSIGGVGRQSIGGRSLQPVRDGIDHWLRERETDYREPESAGDNSSLSTPRPSGVDRRPSGLGRFSMAPSEAGSLFQVESMDDMVDEQLAADEAAVIERCFQHINDFATEGLRTLLYGYRFLNDGEYATWKKGYLEATTSLVDRARLVEEAGDLIEQQLELAGGTAIEDKLQQGVPEAIDKLRRAKIKMWMLTGDKRETAINIGHSCRLIKDYSIVTVLDYEAGEVEQSIGAAILDINRGTVAHSVVVIDGQTLAQINESEPLTLLFYDLAILADSVICCRASPAQKASLVKNIRKRVKNTITLAIGDGANDIAMIQEAHVGIGITGKEGLQAARTSDYSIAQFRFLTKLLLVHGRWNYVRTCKYTVATFWKEFLFYLTQALYQRSVGYTGTSLYESWSLSMFNTLFTSIPVIFLGIFEKDLAASTLLAVPELYTKGQRNGGFNLTVYLGWMFMASGEAMLVYFCMFSLYGRALFTEDNSIFALGTLSYTAIVILINVKLQFIETHSKTWTNVLALALSIGVWFLWNVILSAVYNASSTIYYVRSSFLSAFGQSLTWWLALILIVVSALVFEFGVDSLRAAFFATDEDVFQALEKDPLVKRRFEEAASSELQAGWDRNTNKEREKMVADEERREGEVKELLRNRIEEVDFQNLKIGTPGRSAGGGGGGGDEDPHRALERGYGKVQ